MKLRQFIEGQRKNRKSLSQKQRLALWKRAHGRCWYCGCQTAKTFFVLEHVEPFSRGGADSARNLVVSCWECDRNKGRKNLEEYRAKCNGIEFYGETGRALAQKRTAEEREARRAANKRQKEERKRAFNPRMVQLSEKMPATVAALMIAERGKYVREPYRF